MSLGILSFACTTLLGLLPMGLGLFRNALDTSVESQIIQRMAGDLQQADFDTMLKTSCPVRYFDEQGNEKTTPQSGLYWVKVGVFPSCPLPSASGTASNPNTDLAKVVVQIAFNPGNRPLLSAADGTWQEDKGISFRKRAFFIARNTPVE